MTEKESAEKIAELFSRNSSPSVEEIVALLMETENPSEDKARECADGILEDRRGANYYANTEILARFIHSKLG